MVQQVLDSRFPKAVTWGREFITIYNDAFRPILGDKPEALGRPFGEVWAEVWDQIGPIAQSAMEGQSTFIENFPLVIDRTVEELRPGSRKSRRRLRSLTEAINLLSAECLPLRNRYVAKEKKPFNLPPTPI